jgi:hypothetical protein
MPHKTASTHPEEMPSIPRMRIAMMKRIFSALAVAIALVLCLATPAEHALAQTVPVGTFKLVNYYSSWCAGVASGEDNTGAIQWGCTAAVDQTWNLGAEDGTTGYYEVINGDGECLGVYNGSTAAGADVVGWQCLGTVTNPDLDQYWAWVQSSESGFYYLKNLKSGQVLGVLNNSTSQGAQLVQWPDQNMPNNQLWQAGPGQTVATTQPSTPLYAGYSAYPISGYVTNVEGTWTVPPVNCSSAPNARVAVWVGMWGGTTSIQYSTAWLPQIGTVSQCYDGQPYYFLIWEMESLVPGGGNGAQDGYTSGTYYNVTGNLPTYENLLSPAFLGDAEVSAGDSISANVFNVDASNSTATERTFDISLEDNTTGKYAVGTIATNQAVSPGNIASQGGVMVESSGVTASGSFPGLAQFSPLTIGPVYVDGGTGGWGFFKWAMQNNGDQLANAGPLQITETSPSLLYDYSVTWQNAT